MSSAAVVSGDEASLSSPRRDPDMEILSRLDRYIDRFRQGAVYAKVIDAVCESSQVDFEEGGVDQGTLELLRSVRDIFILLCATAGWQHDRHPDSGMSFRLPPSHPGGNERF